MLLPEKQGVQTAIEPLQGPRDHRPAARRLRARAGFGVDLKVDEPDDASLQGASYYVTNSTRWGVSSIGLSLNGSYMIYTSNQFTNTLDSVLFQTARMSTS